jgi:hypothetical protein
MVNIFAYGRTIIDSNNWDHCCLLFSELLVLRRSFIKTKVSFFVIHSNWITTNVNLFLLFEHTSYPDS